MDRAVFVPRAAALVGAGAAGAGVALAVAFAIGGFGATKTTQIREITIPTTSVASGTTPIRYGELTIGEIYHDVAPGVVQITATSEVVTPADPFANPLGPTVQTEKALGSGFVIDKAGHIVTNYHVVAGAESVQVSFSTTRDEGDDRRLRPLHRPRRPEDQRACALAHPAQPRQLERLRSATPSSPSATRSASTRTVTAGIVSALQRADQRAEPVPRSTTSSRPTPRSTTATPAARS